MIFGPAAMVVNQDLLIQDPPHKEGRSSCYQEGTEGGCEDVQNLNFERGTAEATQIEREPSERTKIRNTVNDLGIDLWK